MISSLNYGLFTNSLSFQNLLLLFSNWNDCNIFLRDCFCNVRSLNINIYIFYINITTAIFFRLMFLWYVFLSIWKHSWFFLSRSIY